MRKFNELYITGDELNSTEISKDDYDAINDVCLELSDEDFHTLRVGNRSDVKLIPADSMFGDNNSVIAFSKGPTGHIPFTFDEVKDFVYRIKDIVGIENIDTFNYHIEGHDSYTRGDLEQLENETINIEQFDRNLKPVVPNLVGAFLLFNFPVRVERIKTIRK